MASQERSMPFIKNLASSDRKIRTAALTSLRTFLSAKQLSTALSTLDILKLWKGLFYALWMCDRPLPQQQLCADLADLIWILPSHKVVISWLRGFWATMAREWTTGIDVLRMEKFLLLVRRVLGASLVWMQIRPEESQQEEEQRSPTKRSTRGGKKRAANGETKTTDTKTDSTKEGEGVRFHKARVEAILSLLADWPFHPDEETVSSSDNDEDHELMPKMVPVGLKLHALDIWVDEAEKAGIILSSSFFSNSPTTKEDGEIEKETFSAGEVLQRLHTLVKTLRAETQAPAVKIRSKESLADERLPWNQKTDEEEKGQGEGDEWSGLDD